MAQHDYIIANQSGAGFRSDLNNALAAIVSQNSGASAPSTTYAYQFWADTTTGLLKIRNAANSAWIALRELDGTLTIEDGTAAAPGLAFESDINTGLYRVGADQLGFATGGTGRLLLDASGNLVIGDVSDTNTYIGHPAADTLAVTTGGSERCRVDSSGKLLVGATTARANFFNSTFSPLVQFEGANNDGARLQSFTYGRASSGDGPIFVLAKCRDNSVGGNTAVASGDQLGWLSFQGSDGTQFVEGASIRAEVDGTPGADDLPCRLVFSTCIDGASSPTERLRITSTGETYFQNQARFYNASYSTTNYHYIGKDSSGAFVVYNQATTGVYLANGGTSWTANSDERLKTDLKPITNAAQKVSTLRAVTGRYLNDAEDVSRAFLIAQDVQSVLPEAVNVQQDENRTLGLQYTDVIPLLVAAIKEQQSMISVLQAKVAALEAQ